MPAPESLEDFYRHKFNYMPENLARDLGHFNVFRRDDLRHEPDRQVSYNRRDFYKISLLRGKYLYHYADKTLEADGVALSFFSPTIPYTFDCDKADTNGYFCIFREAFFSEYIRGGLKDLPMFRAGARPIYMLNDEQDAQISSIFEKMHSEMAGDYAFKFDLVRNYIMEIIHAALKLEPSASLHQHSDANARITAVFTELLERQFPIESPSQQLRLRSAGDFASQLNVHTNHLNRALRSTTGKTTSTHIAERLAAEAMALLKHTDWNISEISYSLGFEEPAHFNHFFKKQTSVAPSAYRR